MTNKLQCFKVANNTKIHGGQLQNMIADKYDGHDCHDG